MTITLRNGRLLRDGLVVALSGARRDAGVLHRNGITAADKVAAWETV